MTSIYDIPIDDIILFLRGNNISVPEIDKEAYREARKLMKNPKLLFYPPSVITWMVAYNLLVTKTKISSYTEEEILNLPQKQLNSLARLLTMNSNDRYNVIKILQYMGKL